MLTSNVATTLGRTLALTVAGGFTLAASMASATVPITESFETPVLPGLSVQYGPDQVSFNTNAVGAVSIPSFTFSGFSGIISNGTLGVFNNTTAGNQAAFVQSYLGTGSQINWFLSGLNQGQLYRLTFSNAGSLIVPTASFTVSGLGLASTSFTPGTVYATNSLYFLADNASGFVSFSVQGAPGNAATALDAFSVTAVPEPATWAMMLAGFGMIGFGMRSRRKQVVRVTYA